MHHRWLIPVAALLASSAPAAAQLPELPGRPGPWRLAWPADSAHGLRFGMAMLPPPVPLDFRLTDPEPRLFTRVPIGDWLRARSAAAARRLEGARGTLPLPGERNEMLVAAAQPETTTPDTSAFLPRPAAPDTARGGELIGGLVGQHADLGMRVTGLGELGGSWTRYEPCDPSIHLNCNPSLFPRLTPNVEFGVQVGGTISDRIHVNVDYDQRREDFSAANNINVFYQGLPHEVLQRVEVGDVSLRLPRSQYMTRGVAAGNFGLMASGQLGPLDFQAVWAQQRGDLTTREFRRAGGGTDGLVQDESLVLDDADYAEGQFFFLLHPDSMAGAPHVDVLALRATDAPATLRPEAGGTLELYRDERTLATNPQQQAQLGIFLADAISEDASLKHTGQFRRLTPEQDYYVHSSGLWIMLRSPLRQDEALAASYRTETGEIVGTPNAEQAPPGQPPVLRLLRSPVASHQPGGPTWDFEMHQVYRLSGTSGVDPASIDLRVSLGDLAGGRTFRDVGGRQVTFLRLFGLDEDSPRDAIDLAQVFQPDRDELSAGSRIGGTFLVLPTLQPFLDPPPVPSENLTAEETRAALGGDANATIYENPDPIARDGGARFRLNFTYRVHVDGLVSSFSLGQFGIREGTERIQVGDRTLQRDVDYTIDYELGLVTLNDAQSLFAAAPDADIRAVWEQRTLFDIAPTSVFGANLRYSLGPRGELNFVGLFQSERTLYNRPQLGVEPGALFLGGTSASLDLGGALLDRMLARIPGMRLTAPSSVHLDAEVALSLPDPNRRGEAYLDDFEGGDEVPLDVRRQQWRLGSAPSSHAGADATFPPVFDASTAARLVWQHDIAAEGAITGNLLPQRDIDRQINVAGNALPEPVMWLTFGDADEPASPPSWRSITTVLSTTGRDMTRSEFLEFYARADDPRPLALIVDLGTVGEDAFHIDASGATSGTYPDGRPWGLGILDEEASVAQREVWGPDRDALGLWDQDCAAEPLTPYPLGDERANCTRGNGAPDTEDLDGNGILDADDGAHFRYVVHLTQPSPHMVRDTVGTGTRFRLYRIPLRGANAIAVNGATEGTLRFIRHLRVTVVGESGGRRGLVIARPRIIGSRWTKRDIHGIQRGLLADEAGLGAATTELRVGPASRLTDGASYTPPPGVRDELQDPTAQFGGAGVEFNEKSLRIAYDGLVPDDRAEVYLRYPQTPQNFLTYRQLRLWAVARAGEWGPNGGERLVVRLGTDPRNFYLFQARLRPATGDRSLTEADWLPEIVIDFEPWFALKAEAEQRLIEGGAALVQDTVWSADSTYAIVLEDRARAPNLAAIRELSFAVYNGGVASATGEVWIDDVRLAGANRDPGAAGAIDLSVTGDFLSGSFQYANRGSVFRQLNEDPRYQRAGDFRAYTRAQLDRLLPESWGVDVPLTVEHTSSSLDPSFLERTDVRADRLPGLRETGAGLTRVGLTLRKSAPSQNPWAALLLDGATLRIGYNAAHTNTITSRAETGGLDAALDYRHQLAPRTLAAIPAFVEGALRALAPAAVENSDFFQRLVGSRLRWSPAHLGFGTSWYDQDARSFRFDRILATAADSTARAIESPRQGLENHAELGLRPFDPLSAVLTLRSSRDLLDAERATTIAAERDAIERARTRLAGADIGWETRRSLHTNVSFRPDVTSWLRPSYTWSNRFSTDRNASYIERLDPDGDAAVLQRRFGNDRQISRRLDFQPGAMLAAAFGPAADSARGVGGLMYDLGSALQAVNVTWNSGLNSRFERETSAPGTGYQFGFGDLAGFRVIDADTAVTALDRDDVRVNSSIATPFRGTLALGFQRSRTEGFDLRGGRRLDRQTSWPSVRLSWSQVPLPAAVGRALLNASAGVGYEHAERSSVYGSSGAARGGAEDRFPLELSLSFPAGLSAIYTGTLSRGTAEDPTGNAETDGLNHTLQLSGVFQPPGFLAPRITNPIQTMIVFTQDDQRHCRFRTGSLDECVPFIDTSVRALNLTLDTNLSDLNVGLRLAYTSRHSHVGTRTGSNQFQLGLFGRFNFAAGQLPAALPPGRIR